MLSSIRHLVFSDNKYIYIRVATLFVLFIHVETLPMAWKDNDENLDKILMFEC